MTDIEQRAFQDLDEIEQLSEKALRQLRNGEDEELQVTLEKIQSISALWQ